MHVRTAGRPAGRRRRIGSRRWTAVPVALAALVLAGCSDPQQVIQSGTTGTNSQIGDILLRNVYLDEPPALAYPPGSDPPVILTLVNQGAEPDTLVRITTPVARQVVIRRDLDCDGTVETLPRLDLPPQTDLASPPNAPGPIQADYFLRLVDLTRTVRPGTTVPLTFTFADAGTATVDAKVGLPGAGRVEPPGPCTPTTS